MSDPQDEVTVVIDLVTIPSRELRRLKETLAATVDILEQTRAELDRTQRMLSEVRQKYTNAYTSELEWRRRVETAEAGESDAVSARWNMIAMVGESEK